MRKTPHKKSMPHVCRSKHDQASNAQEGGSVPSAEAHHRLLIGTVMLSKNTTTVRSPAQMLKVERATVLTEVDLVNIVAIVTMTIITRLTALPKSSRT